MRQISGAWWRDGTFELTAGDDCSRSEAAGVRVVITSHTNDTPSADDLLKLYSSAGPSALRKLAGDAAFVVFDRTNDLLILASDLFGTTPLYYVADGHRTAFATSVRKLLQNFSFEAAPNRRSLAAFLVDFAGPRRGETYFADVCALPAGSMMIQRGRGVTIVNADPPIFATSNRTFEETIEVFRNVFRAAVRRRVDTGSTSAVLVSGGLDSAAVLCTAAGFGSVVGVTYGLEDGGPADETRFVDMLRNAGHRIERVPFYPTVDVEGIERSVLDSEGPAVDYVALTQRRAASAARSLGATSLLMGALGDQVLSPFPPPDLGSIPPWRRYALRAAARDFQRYMTDVPIAEIEDALFRQSLRRRAPLWLREARRRRNRGKTPFDVLAADFPPPPLAPVVTNFGAAAWHSVTTPAVVDAIAGITKWGFSSDVDVRLPFLDTDLVRLLVSVRDDQAYRDNSLKPLLRHAMSGIVPNELLARRDKGDYTAAITAGIPAHAVLLEQLNGLRECVDFGLMSRRSAAQTMARLHRSAEIDTERRRLMELASLSIFMRIFFTTARAVK